jgi:hypothetical protein
LSFDPRQEPWTPVDDNMIKKTSFTGARDQLAALINNLACARPEDERFPVAGNLFQATADVVCGQNREYVSLIFPTFCHGPLDQFRGVTLIGVDARHVRHVIHVEVFRT